MFTVIDKVFGDRHSPQDKAHFLEVSHHNSAYFGQSDPTPKVVAAKVNALLRAHSTSNDALLLLDCFLDVLPHNIVKGDVVAWIRSVTRLISCKKADPGQHIAWNVLLKLLQRVAKYTELSKDVPDVVSGILQKILEDLSPEVREPREGALKCLHTCMKHFGVLLGSQQGVLEKLLCRHLVGWNSSAVQELVCQCLAYLPWCCRGGVHKQTEMWAAQMRRLVATVNVCLDSLFEDLHVARSNVSADAALTLENSTSFGPHSTVFLNWRRVQNSSHAISLMFSTGVSHTVPVPSEEIIRVVSRMLSVSPSMMYSQPTAHEKMIASIMPSLQGSALELLKQLILSCRQTLARETESITEMVLQVILRSASQSCIDIRRLRKMAYSALGLWLQVSKSGSSLEGRVDKLISVLLKDIQIVTGSIELSRKGSNTVPSSPFITEDGNHVDILEDLCEQALHVLRQIVCTHGTRLKSDLLQEVQRNVVVLLLKIQQRRYNLPQPYGSPRCRSALYATLLSLMVNFNTSIPPPLHCCIRIFSAGLHDTSFEVAELCTHALACGTLIAHPLTSSLSRHALSGKALRCIRTTRDVASQTAADLADTTCAATQTTAPTFTAQEAKHHRPRHAKRHPYSTFRDEVYSDGEECEEEEEEYDEDELYHEEVEEEQHHNGLRTHNGGVAIAERSMYFKERLPLKRSMNRSPVREEYSSKRLHSEDVDEEESLDDESLGSMDEEEEVESESGAEDVSTAADVSAEMEFIDLDNEAEEAADEAAALSSELGSTQEAAVAAEPGESNAQLETEPVPEPELVTNTVEASLEDLGETAPKQETGEGVPSDMSDELCTKADEVQEVKAELEGTENHVDSTSAAKCAEEKGEEVIEEGKGDEGEAADANVEKVPVSDPQKSSQVKDGCGPDVAEMLLDFVDCSPDD
ncbi:proline-, glutamic acid- and leucine-rich protein 1-like isoform X2 [Ornithodoros turicata]|uniref:proline-, glutamic acid- and leucine-rich protein 1-like isoform X2 n=1 Tax=Ornithodoros turicata TaxID=34597 RepID=UPI00313861EB